MIALFLHLSLLSFSQTTPRDTVIVDKKIITLSEVVVNTNINVPSFIERVKNDTSFYKAFKNLRILKFTSLNDIRILDKKKNVKASLNSRTKQEVARGCRHTTVLEESTTGDIYDKERKFNYYTASLYASLFFAYDTVCGETNIVKGAELDVSSKSGMAKHKEQLKMLFFNPGKSIPGLPFIGNKLAIFDADMSDLYDYDIDEELKAGESCYVFRIKAKADLSSGQKDKIVIDEMTTWFNQKTFEVIARNYSMSYHAFLYDFNVNMEVSMSRFENYLVPTLIRYVGNWNVIFKRREDAVFTATLFDFENP
ncbi:MAG: hypothetical protein C5B52_10145 [Bacteroidetes bacterium]|nr:MAG: hypothetical protein C5B52_10145 [Bacteroidota bacterium]